MDLSHHFLVSMPGLDGSEFHRSLIYLLDHGSNGAFGVVINQLSDMPLGDVLEQLEIETPDEAIRQVPVLRGGPVEQGHGLVLHPSGPDFDCTREFEGGISLSSSRDVLEAVAAGGEPHHYLVMLGHAGWAPGQLETEVASNAWLTAAGDADILFHTPLAHRREAVGAQLGIDLKQLVGDAGRA